MVNKFLSKIKKRNLLKRAVALMTTATLATGLFASADLFFPEEDGADAASFTIDEETEVTVRYNADINSAVLDHEKIYYFAGHPFSFVQNNGTGNSTFWCNDALIDGPASSLQNCHIVQDRYGIDNYATFYMSESNYTCPSSTTGYYPTSNTDSLMLVPAQSYIIDKEIKKIASNNLKFTTSFYGNNFSNLLSLAYANLKKNISFSDQRIFQSLQPQVKSSMDKLTPSQKNKADDEFWYAEDDIGSNVFIKYNYSQYYNYRYAEGFGLEKYHTYNRIKYEMMVAYFPSAGFYQPRNSRKVNPNTGITFQGNKRTSLQKGTLYNYSQINFDNPSSFTYEEKQAFLNTLSSYDDVQARSTKGYMGLAILKTASSTTSLDALVLPIEDDTIIGTNYEPEKCNNLTFATVDDDNNALTVLFDGKTIVDANINGTYRIGYNGANTEVGENEKKYIDIAIYDGSKIVDFCRAGEVTSSTGSVQYTIPRNLDALKDDNYKMLVFEETASTDGHSSTFSTPKVAKLTLADSYIASIEATPVGDVTYGETISDKSLFKVVSLTNYAMEETLSDYYFMETSEFEQLDENTKSREAVLSKLPNVNKVDVPTVRVSDNDKINLTFIWYLDNTYFTTTCDVNIVESNLANEEWLKYKQNDITWLYQLDNDGNAIKVHTEDDIEPIISADGTLSIPSTIGKMKYPVVSIGGGTKDKPFANVVYSMFSSIEFPSTLKEINNYAFYKSRALLKLSIPKQVERIGESAFNDSYISVLSIESNDLSIEKGAFNSCSKMSKVTITGNKINIGQSAFGNNTVCEQLTINNKSTEIGTQAFFGNAKISQITITSENVMIGERAFEKCYTKSADATMLVIKGAKASIGAYAFTNNTKLTHVSLASNSITVDDYAFANDISLTQVVMNNSVTLKEYVFNKCSALKQVKFSGTSQYTTEVGTNAFNGCTALKDISFEGEQSVTLKPYAFNGCTSLASVYLPEYITAEEYAFNNCTGLKTISIGMEILGNNVFANCYDITKVVLNKNVQTVSANWGGYAVDASSGNKAEDASNDTGDDRTFYVENPDTVFEFVKEGDDTYYSALGYMRSDSDTAANHRYFRNNVIYYLEDSEQEPVISTSGTAINVKATVNNILEVNRGYGALTNEQGRLITTANKASTISQPKNNEVAKDDVNNAIKNTTTIKETVQSGVNATYPESVDTSSSIKKSLFTVYPVYEDGSPYTFEYTMDDFFAIDEDTYDAFITDNPDLFDETGNLVASRAAFKEAFDAYLKSDETIRAKELGEGVNSGTQNIVIVVYASQEDGETVSYTTTVAVKIVSTYKDATFSDLLTEYGTTENISKAINNLKAEIVTYLNMMIVNTNDINEVLEIDTRVTSNMDKDKIVTEYKKSIEALIKSASSVGSASDAKLILDFIAGKFADATITYTDDKGKTVVYATEKSYTDEQYYAFLESVPDAVTADLRSANEDLSIMLSQYKAIADKLDEMLGTTKEATLEDIVTTTNGSKIFVNGEWYDYTGSLSDGGPAVTINYKGDSDAQLTVSGKNITIKYTKDNTEKTDKFTVDIQALYNRLAGQLTSIAKDLSDLERGLSEIETMLNDAIKKFGLSADTVEGEQVSNIKSQINALIDEITSLRKQVNELMEDDTQALYDQIAKLEATNKALVEQLNKLTTQETKKEDSYITVDKETGKTEIYVKGEETVKAEPKKDENGEVVKKEIIDETTGEKKEVIIYKDPTDDKKEFYITDDNKMHVIDSETGEEIEVRDVSSVTTDEDTGEVKVKLDEEKVTVVPKEDENGNVVTKEVTDPETGEKKNVIVYVDPEDNTKEYYVDKDGVHIIDAETGEEKEVYTATDIDILKRQAAAQLAELQSKLKTLEDKIAEYEATFATIREALGLPEDATDEEVIEKISEIVALNNKLNGDNITLREQNATLEAYVDILKGQLKAADVDPATQPPVVTIAPTNEAGDPVVPEVTEVPDVPDVPDVTDVPASTKDPVIDVTVAPTKVPDKATEVPVVPTKAPENKETEAPVVPTKVPDNPEPTPIIINNTEEVTKLKAQISELQSQNSALKKDVADLTKVNSELVTAKSTLETSNSKLTADVSKLTTDNTVLTKNNTTLSADKAKLETENKELVTENEALTASNSTLTSQNASLTKKNSTLTSTNKTLKSQNRSLTSKNSTLSNKVNSLQKTNSSLTSQVSSLKSQLASANKGGSNGGGNSVPSYTIKPYNPTNPTVAPKKTISPKVTTKPNVTAKPSITTAPEVTFMPEVTEEPVITFPTDTDQPNYNPDELRGTNDPSETGSPEKSGKSGNGTMKLLYIILAFGAMIAVGVGAKLYFDKKKAAGTGDTEDGDDDIDVEEEDDDEIEDEEEEE